MSGTISVLAGRLLQRHDQERDRRVRAALAPARVSILKQFSVEPTFSLTRIELPDGTFTTRAGARASRLRILAADVRERLAAVQLRRPRLQHATCAFAGSTRPGSELFLVYTDERATPDERFDTPTTIRGLKNRVFVVKANRLLRF